MKQTIFKGILLTTLGAALASAPAVIAKSTQKAPAKKAPAKTTKAATPKWLTSHKDALAEAKKTGKPILIDLNATWCGPCHMMEDEVFKKAAFAPEAKKWVLLSIDVDKHPDMAKHYDADSLPMLVVLDSKGRSAARQPGYGGYDYTMKFIKDAYKKAKK